MKLRARAIFQVAALSMLFYLVSCATVTVNVYFPAEEVRQAYSDLEQEFLGPPGEENSETETSPAKNKSATEPQSLRKYPDKPIVTQKKAISIREVIDLDFGEYAWAQGNISDQIANRIRKTPKAVQAYKSRGQRRSVIDGMLSGGKVKEGAQGLLVKTGTLTSSETQAFNAENSDRNIIIDAMSKIILDINNIEATPEKLEQVRPQAAKEFAKARGGA